MLNALPHATTRIKAERKFGHLLNHSTVTDHRDELAGVSRGQGRHCQRGAFVKLEQALPARGVLL